MACRSCWNRSKPPRLVLSWKGSGTSQAGRTRSTKIFVDNTKTFVLSSAHDQRTFAKANGVGTGNPARALGARAFHGAGGPCRAARKEGPRLHHRPETAPNHDRQGQCAQKRRPPSARL